MSREGTHGRVAVWQGAALPGAPLENARRAAAWVRHAAEAHGVTAAVFPELFLSGYDVPPAVLRASALPADSWKGTGDASAGESADGGGAGEADSDALRVLAREAGSCGCAVLVGYAEKSTGGKEAEEAEYFNSVAVFDCDGSLKSNYRKTHLFGDHEGSVFKAGGPDELKPFELEAVGLPMGVLICFDVEFPEPARTLSFRGARILAVPTAIGDRPESLVIPFRVAPTRATENLVFVAYSNLLPRPKSGDVPFACDPPINFCGSSALIAPDGTVLERAGPYAECEAALPCGVPSGKLPAGLHGSCTCETRPAAPDGYPTESLHFTGLEAKPFEEHFKRNDYFAHTRPDCYEAAHP